MKRVIFLLLITSLIPSAYAALPGDSANGKRLHDANCGGCHDSSVYTRNNRRVKSMGALQGQLQGCSHMAKMDFSVTEQQDIVKYLNDRFYHFQ